MQVAIPKNPTTQVTNLYSCFQYSTFQDLGVSKNRGIPKWMVKIMENLMNKWMIWGENPLIFGNTHLSCFSTQAEVMAETPEQPRSASPPPEVKAVTPVIPVSPPVEKAAVTPVIPVSPPVEKAETPVEPVKPKVESLNLSL